MHDLLLPPGLKGLIKKYLRLHYTKYNKKRTKNNYKLRTEMIHVYDTYSKGSEKWIIIVTVKT